MPSEDHASDLLARADVLIDAGRSRDALPLIRQARAADPQSARACCFQAMAHINLEEWREAREPAEAAVRLEPDAEWGQRLRAIALLNLGQTRAALQAAEAALRLCPELREALHITLRCQWALGKKREARETAARLLKVAPEWSATHDFYGKMALDERKWKEAEPHYRRALELNPQSWTAMHNLGLALKAQGRRKEAIECFHLAAKIDPQRQLIQTNLKQAVQEHGESWGVALLYIIGLGSVAFFATSSRHNLVLGGVALVVVLFVSTVMALRYERKRLRELHPEVGRFVQEDQRRRRDELRRQLPQVVLLLAGIAVWASAGIWTLLLIRQGPRAVGLLSPWVVLYVLDVAAAVTGMVRFIPWLRSEVERSSSGR